MSRSLLHVVLRHAEAICTGSGEEPDAELLRRFVRNRDEAAPTRHVAYDPYPREHVLGPELPPSTQLEAMSATDVPMSVFTALQDGTLPQVVWMVIVLVAEWPWPTAPKSADAGSLVSAGFAASTAPLCARGGPSGLPVAVSHNRPAPSESPVKTVRPFGLKARLVTLRP